LPSLVDGPDEDTEARDDPDRGGDLKRGPQHGLRYIGTPSRDVGRMNGEVRARWRMNLGRHGEKSTLSRHASSAGRGTAETRARNEDAILVVDRFTQVRMVRCEALADRRTDPSTAALAASRGPDPGNSLLAQR
jgi:hypothetical protein